MSKKVTADIKAGDGFSLKGNIDGVTREYTVIERTTARPLVNGQPVAIENIIAHNHTTDKKTVFALASLVGVATLA